MASGNIDTIDYKYGTNLLYGIRYNYYDDKNIKTRIHTYADVSGGALVNHIQYYTYDAMKQLTYWGPDAATAAEVQANPLSGNAATRYDKTGQKTFIRDCF